MHTYIHREVHTSLIQHLIRIKEEVEKPGGRIVASEWSSPHSVPAISDSEKRDRRAAESMELTWSSKNGGKGIHMHT